MPGSGLHVSFTEWSSKKGQRRYRWLLAACAAALALSVIPGAGAVAAYAQVAPTPRTTASLTRASGTTTTKRGLDPDTSFCFGPKPAPTSITNDPVKPKCTPLPKSTVPNTTNPFVIATPYPGWAAPLAGSKWVGPQPNGRDNNEGAPKWYVYDASFTSKGCSQLNGAALADNQVGVFLNGQLLAHQTSSSATSNFAGPPLSFTAIFSGGSAVVDFVVYDSSGPATGLDYSFTVTSLPAADCQPVITGRNVLTIGKAGGTAVKTGAVLKSSLAKGTSAVFSTDLFNLTCKSASFTARVTKNPRPKGTATESQTAQAFSKCSVSLTGVTVKSITVSNLPYNVSVSDSKGDPVSVTGTKKTKPVSTTVTVSDAGSSFACSYKIAALKGTASNKGNLITFTKQVFTMTSGSSLCPSTATFTGEFGPVTDASVLGSPAVFVN